MSDSNFIISTKQAENGRCAEAEADAKSNADAKADVKAAVMAQAEAERCVICGAETEYTKDVPIGERERYIEGGGQLCLKCYYEILKAGK